MLICVNGGVTVYGLHWLQRGTDSRCGGVGVSVRLAAATACQRHPGVANGDVCAGRATMRDESGVFCDEVGHVAWLHVWRCENVTHTRAQR